MSRHANVKALGVQHDRDVRRFMGREERKIRHLAKDQPTPSSPATEKPEPLSPDNEKTKPSSPAADNNTTVTNYVRYRGTKIMLDEAMAFSIAFSKVKSAAKLVNEMSKLIPAWQLVLGFNVNRMEDVRKLKNALMDVRAEIIAADPDPSQSDSFFDFFERFVRIGQWLLASSLTSSQGENELSSFPGRDEFERVWTELIAALKALTEFRAYYASDKDVDHRLDTRTRTEQVTAIDTLLHDLIRENSNTMETTCENLSRCYTFALEKGYESVMWIASTLHEAYLDGPAEEYAGPALDDRDAISTAMRHLTMMVTSGYQVITHQALQKQGPVVQKYFIVHHRHFQAMLRTLTEATLPEETVADRTYVIDALNRGSTALIKAGVVPDELTGQTAPPSTVDGAKSRYLSMIRMITNGIMYPLSQEFHSLHALATSGFGKAVCRNRFILSLNAAVVQATNNETAVNFAVSLVSNTLGDEYAMDVKEVSNAIDYWNNGLGVTQHIMKGTPLPAAIQKSSSVALQQVISGDALPTGKTAMDDIHDLLRNAVALYPATFLTADLSDELGAGIEFDASLQGDIQRTTQNIASYVSRDEDTANEIRAVDDITDALLRGAQLKELTSLTSSLGSGNIFSRLIEGIRRIDAMYLVRDEHEVRHLRRLSQFATDFLNGILEDMPKKSNVKKARALLTEITFTAGRVPEDSADAKTIRANGTALVRKFKASADSAKNNDSRSVFLLLAAIAGIETSISDLTFSVEIPLNAPSLSDGKLGAPKKKKSVVKQKLRRTTQIIIHTVASIAVIGFGAFLMYSMYDAFAADQETAVPPSTPYGQTYNTSYAEEITERTTEHYVTGQTTNEITEILATCNVTRFSDLPGLPDEGAACRTKLVNVVTDFGVDIAENVVFQPDGKACGQYIGSLLYGAQDPISKELPPSVIDSMNRAWTVTLNVNQTDIPALLPRNVGNVFGESGTLLDIAKLNYEEAIRHTVERRLDLLIYPNANNIQLANSTTVDQSNALLVQMYADGIRFPQELANISSNFSPDIGGRADQFFGQLAPYGDCRFYRARSNDTALIPGRLYPVPSPGRSATDFPVAPGTYQALGYLSTEGFVPNKPGAMDVATNSVVTGTWLGAFCINSVIYALPGKQPTREENIGRFYTEAERRTLEDSPEAQGDLRKRYIVFKVFEAAVAIAPLGMTAGLMAYDYLAPASVFEYNFLDPWVIAGVGFAQVVINYQQLRNRYFS